MAINYEHLRDYVIIPTLKYLDPDIPYSEEAVDLLLLTAAHESKLGTFLKQINGPACGIFQMEPSTHDDIWDNYLSYRDFLFEAVVDLTSTISGADESELITNLAYATAMARVHYYRVPTALPKKSFYETEEDYIQALAVYAKEHYNSYEGKATVSKYYWAYQKYCI